MVSDVIRKRPIWFGGQDRSEASMAMFYEALGTRKSAGVRLPVMDMWKPFRKATQAHAPQAAILFDKFHIMANLGKALDAVRKYTLLSPAPGLRSARRGLPTPENTHLHAAGTVKSGKTTHTISRRPIFYLLSYSVPNRRPRMQPSARSAGSPFQELPPPEKIE